MLLFLEEFVEPILAGHKTQTRRVWGEKPRAKVGARHQARTSLFGKPFAILLITARRRERLGDISAADAVREGCAWAGGGKVHSASYALRRFRQVWRQIQGGWRPNTMVWVVDFKLDEVP
jgi:hypothetical protein